MASEGNEVNELLKQALRYEEENKLSESEQCYLKALVEYPDDKEVLCYLSIFLFKKGDYEKALDYFVISYSHPEQAENTKEDLLNHILVAYYQPYEEIFKKTYENNVSALRNYEHGHIPHFVDFEELSFLCIPRNDSEYYIWDKTTKNFKELIVMDKEMTSYQVAINDCVAAVNIFDITKLNSLVEQTKNPAWSDNIKIPIYVIWCNGDKREQYLQLVNYTTIIELNRVVFFACYTDNVYFDAFFKDHQSLLPNKMVGDNQYFQEIIAKLDQCLIIREQDIKRKLISINQLAQKYDKKYYKKIFSGSFDKIRILFYTCRFTTVIQYATRDFMQACQDLGIECEVVIEKSDIHRSPSSTELIHKIDEFKPNVIFFIHYFKSDFPLIPPNIMSVSWMQDPNYKFTSNEHAKQFRWNDFAMLIAPDWYEQMIKTGYDHSRLSLQSVPVSERIFYKREMSDEERERYTADIAFAGNYFRPEEKLAEIISKFTNNIVNIQEKNRIIHLLISAYDDLQLRIGNDELIQNAEQCEKIINDLAMYLELKIEIDLVKKISQDFFHTLSYYIHRKITLKWLIDYGFQVKLWGGGWEKEPCFKNNAMGMLAHGEELAKMYSCTKILPGAFSGHTEHFRLLESSLCGVLYMARHIPAEFDIHNIRKGFMENEEFVFYHNRQDLIDKVNYYLKHETERKRVVDNCSQKVLDAHTYSSAVHKCLSRIKKNLVSN